MNIKQKYFKYILIGQRGAGKTSIINKLQNICFDKNLEIQCLDLDNLIEKEYNINIKKFFETYGEAKFREIENQVFKNFYKKQNVDSQFIIAMGAGFSGDVPDDVKAIWIRRRTDSLGRVFINRPILNKVKKTETSEIALGALLQDSLIRYEQRENYYRNHCYFSSFIPEGGLDADRLFNLFFGKSLRKRILLTLDGNKISSLKKINEFLAFCHRIGIESFEIRDDLVDLKTWKIINESNINLSKCTLAIRLKNTPLLEYKEKFKVIDWAYELGDPEVKADVISLHDKSLLTSLVSKKDFQKKLKDSQSYIKIAIPVDSWNSLIDTEASLKQLNLNERVVFLPISNNGRWLWYRLNNWKDNEMNFINCFFSEILDQPSYFEINLNLNSLDQNKNYFGAVLGAPVIHSRTPCFHNEFATENNMNIFSIDIQRDEYSSKVLLYLLKKGLKFAAITSPLKNIFFHGVTTECSLGVNSLSGDLVNSLAVTKNGVINLDNTDYFSIKDIDEHHSQIKIVWGAGALAKSFINNMDNVLVFSARSGLLSEMKLSTTYLTELKKYEVKNVNIKSKTELLKNYLMFSLKPIVLIWACGNAKNIQLPNYNWNFTKLIDLSYGENSLGREYAINYDLDYLSGLRFFNVQAQKQNDFWRKYVDQ